MDNQTLRALATQFAQYIIDEIRRAREATMVQPPAVPEVKVVQTPEAVEEKHDYTAEIVQIPEKSNDQHFNRKQIEGSVQMSTTIIQWLFITTRITRGTPMIPMTGDHSMHI